MQVVPYFQRISVKLAGRCTSWKSEKMFHLEEAKMVMILL